MFSFVSDEFFCEPPATCFQLPGYFGSESFLGEFSPNDVTKWVIYPGKRTSYVTLMFNEFDIGCDSGSYFQITHLSHKEDGYCNLNKPFRNVRSSGPKLIVTFHPNLQAESLPEGFSASYGYVPFKSPISHQELWHIALPNNMRKS